MIEKAREFQKNIYFCFNDYVKASDFVDHSKLENLEMGIPDPLTYLLRNPYMSQETTEPDMEQWTGSKLGKEYIKAVYYHSVNLTYMQSTSREMLGWINHSWNQDCCKKYQQPQICR